MEPIYVTGHKNPDTDSIVSAMAYAALRNALGDREYVAARLGHISDETQLVLDRFGMQPPLHLKTLRTQVRDLAYDTPPALHHAVTIAHTWECLQASEGIAALPVCDDEGRLYGMVSAAEIAVQDMQNIHSPLDSVPLFNLLGVLDGTILNEGDDQADTVSGEVVIALPQQHEEMMFRGENSIVICGHQPDMIRRAMETGVSCLIVCQAEVAEELRAIPSPTCLISTPLDAFRAARMVYQAAAVSTICRREGLIAFHLDDYVDDVQETVLKSRYRSYPIVDEDGRVVGTLSRNHLLRPRRKQVVLVDHNELAQSVPGLEQAEILEIIDHHRLADIQTTAPIRFRNEPVGSTATIIAELYQERGLLPPKKLAGLLAAAIVSDTVMFKSPTCTALDHRMAERMARISGVSPETLGQEMFSVSANESRSARDLFFTDYKDFHIAGHDLGVSQITCVNSEKMLERRGEFLALMGDYMEKRGYAMVLLMLTDVLRGGTELLFVGDEDTIQNAFGVEVHDHSCFLPDVMSRKKQVIPMLSALWG